MKILLKKPIIQEYIQKKIIIKIINFKILNFQKQKEDKMHNRNKLYKLLM